MITEQTTNAEENPRDAARLCLAAVANAPLPMVTVQGERHIVRYVNAAFCELVHQPQEELLGKPFCEVVPHQTECVELLDRVLHSGRSESHLEQEQHELHPGFRSYTLWPVIADERPVGVTLQVTETARLQEEAVAMNEALMVGAVHQHELTEAAERLSAQLKAEIAAREAAARDLAEKARLLDLSNDAIMVRDSSNRLTLWNKGSEQLYGWKSEEVLGKDLHTLMQTEFPKPYEEIIAHLHNSGNFSGEVVQIARDGRRITTLCRWVLDPETNSILTSYTDITERKKAEEGLRRAQAELADRALHLERLVDERTAQLRETARELESYSYSIAHDMRAPLRAMTAFARLVQTEHGAQLDETGHAYLGKIITASQRLDHLVTDVLNYSNVSRRKLMLHPVDVEKLLLDTIRGQPEFQPPAADIEVITPLPPVIGHEASLMQVVNNLLANAMKFVLPGTRPNVTVRGELREKDVRLWFEDNGIGIAHADQQRIFSLFGRLHPATEFEGTGIGLTIVRKAVERMGGTVGVESEPGRGSRFWIQLRKADENEANSPASGR